jgi:RHS repeat-associated protein
VELDGRTVSGGYRYGYQGSEKDDELKGNGNSYTTEFRQLDTRIGRWLSIDPVIQPWQSSYCSMDGNPISKNDILGNTTKDWIKRQGKDHWEYDSGIQSAGEAKTRYGNNTEYKDDGETYPGEINGKSIGSVTLNNGGMQTWEKGSYQNPDINPNPNNSNMSAGLHLDEGYTNQNNEQLSNVNLSSFAQGLSSPASLLKNPWGNDIANHPEWQLSRNNCDVLENAVVANLSVPLIFISALEFAPIMISQLSGEVSLSQQIHAWYRVGNTAADAITQSVDISSNGGSWNWGSTFGNITFNNPILSAAPGTINNILKDDNVQSNIHLHMATFGVAVGGGVISKKVGSINPMLMSQGMKHGLSSFTLPIFFNSFGTQFK